MTNPVEDRSATSKWFWIILLILMLVLVIFWFADPLGQTEPAPPAKPAAQSTEWAPEPEGAAVPVTLPTTRLKMQSEYPEGSDGEAKKAE